MQRERLTVERIKRFSCPPDKSQAFLWDQDVQRLAVRVTSSGVKAFVFEGKLDRSTIRWTIGKTAAWTIEDARIEARRLQAMLDKGIDPRELEAAKKAEIAAQKRADEINKKYTLKNLLNAYADHLEERGKMKSAKAARSVINVHVLKSDPALSEKPANKITSDEIYDMIKTVQEAGKERTAGVLRSTINAAYNCARKRFDIAIPKEFRKFNIQNNPVAPISTIPVRAGNRTLSKDELKSYLAAMGETTIDKALKLALYSGGQRMAAILRAEVTDWNAETKVLRLLDPKGKRRQPREHLLPLGPIASSIVSELAAQSKEKSSALLFPSRTNETSIHDSMLGPRVTEIAAAMGGEPFNLRDIRRTVETMLAGLGVSRDIRAQLLSHGISGVQAVHYDRYSYMKEKHAALFKWERYLNKISAGEEEKTVLQFPAG